MCGIEQAVQGLGLRNFWVPWCNSSKVSQSVVFGVIQVASIGHCGTVASFPAIVALLNFLQWLAICSLIGRGLALALALYDSSAFDGYKGSYSYSLNGVSGSIEACVFVDCSNYRLDCGRRSIRAPFVRAGGVSNDECR